MDPHTLTRLSTALKGHPLIVSHYHPGCSKRFEGGHTLETVLSLNRTNWRARVLLRLECMCFVNKCYKVFLWFLLLMYPAASVLVLKKFHCVEVGPHWYLQADMSLLCYSPRW